MIGPRVLALLLAAWLSSPAHAFEDELDAAPEQQSEGPLLWGGVLLRGDHVSGLPGGREDLRRLRARLELGMGSRNAEGLVFGVAGILMTGSDSNQDNLTNLNNEKSDAIALNEAWIGYRTDQVSLVAGKAPIPLRLTPLLWDADFRPIGVSARASFASGDFNRWEFVALAAEPDHPLADSGARMSALQSSWHWREGAASSASLRLGLIEFSAIGGLRRAGLARGNTLSAGRYAFGYRLLDAQIEFRTRILDMPLVANLNAVRNLDAPRERDGARLSLVLGDASVPQGWEFGYAVQRFQRDAVLAAVTSDDWWFHTAAHGYMPWIGYGINARWSVRLAGFRESRDGLSESTSRLLLDLTARW
jgi:hypothetical protein